MNAAALLVVFAAAKALALAGHSIPLSWWTPVAFFWEDAVVVLAFTAVTALIPRTRLFTYVVLVLYAAINVPVARVVSTPLTWPMWRAARGPLADSIRLYLTPVSITIILSVCAIAAIAPRLVRRMTTPATRAMVGGLIVCAALGPAAVARVDASGAERNAWMALATTAIPYVAATPANSWSVTGFEYSRDTRLARWRGAARGRNVVFVSLESTAAQYLGLYGATPDPMPNLSALARSAILFEHAYAVYPESIKGLFSTLCSAYPAIDVRAEKLADVSCESVAAVLRKHKYHTALFHSGRFAYLGMEAVIRNRGFDVLADAGDLGGARESSFGVDESSTVRHVLKWIDAVPSSDRFFVTYLPIAGHHPYDTPERGPFPDDDERGRYTNALKYADAALGSLVDGLAARGLLERTLLVVAGDHGEAFGQHDGNFGHTFHIYDENVRVPFLIAAPGLIGATRVSQVVSLIDAAPTVLDIVGLESPRDYQGRSILDGGGRLAMFFADYSRRVMGLRDGSMKFIDEVETGRGRLFDLDGDPDERVDLSSALPERSAWYRETLRNWSAAQRARIAGRRP